MTFINKETMKPSEIGLKADPLKKKKFSGRCLMQCFYYIVIENSVIESD